MELTELITPAVVIALFLWLGRRIDNLAAETNRRFDSLRSETIKRFDNLSSETNRRFDDTNRRIDALIEQTAQLRERVARLEPGRDERDAA